MMACSFQKSKPCPVFISVRWLAVLLFLIASSLSTATRLHPVACDSWNLQFRGSMGIPSVSRILFSSNKLLGMTNDPFLFRLRGGGTGLESDQGMNTKDMVHKETDKYRHDYEILEEKIIYSKWRTLISRLVRLKNGKLVDFEIVKQPGSDNAVIIFAWDTRTKTATIVREYMPGSNDLKFGLAAGLVEDKHKDVVVVDDDDDNDDDDDDNMERQRLMAAKSELEEECHLVGGTWIQLTSPTSMDKYTTTVVTAYLVIDPTWTPTPKQLDDEEDIEIISSVSIQELIKMIFQGDMNIVSGWACLTAVQKLREMNEL